MIQRNDFLRVAVDKNGNVMIGMEKITTGKKAMSQYAGFYIAIKYDCL